jgi:hypothetical protein
MSAISLDDLNAYSLTTGAGLNENWLWLAVTNDARLDENPEDDHSYLLFWDGSKWAIYDNPFSIRSQAAIERPEAGILSLNYLGGVAFENLASGGYLEDKVGTASGKRVFGRTVLNQARNIAGFTYAVGTHRAVYRRESANTWKVIDRGTFDDDNLDCGFDAIHGFSDKDIYAAGESGEIWQYDGARWIQRESGTNVYLHCVVCATDGKVYAAGAEGTILIGRGDQWSLVEDVPQGLEFWSVEDIQGRIFLAANASLLFELTHGKLALVDFGECPIPTTAHHLFVVGDSLYSLGSKHLRRFDGSIWHELLTLE